MKKEKTPEQLLEENQELRIRLQEAEETLQAIREGAVDAVVVAGPKGDQVFTLTGEEQVYRLMVETMGEAGLTTTPQGKILFCNRQFSRMLDVPMEEILGHDLETFIKASDRRKMAALLVKAQVKPSRKRILFQGGDGTSVPAWVSANQLEQNDSTSICLVVMDQTELEASKEAMRQIAEQREELLARQEELRTQEEELRAQNEELRQVQEQLEESRERYFQLFDFAPVGYFVIDKKGLIIEANLAGAGLLGVERTNLLKKPFARHVEKDDNDTFYLHQKKILGDGQLAECEIRLVRKDKTSIYVRLISEPVRDEQNAVIQCRTAVTDITARKQAEQRLAADLSALTRMHDLSTRILEEEKLEPLMQEIMDTAVAIVGADKGTLQLLEDETLRIAAHHGHQEPFLRFFASAENVASVCGEATRRGQRVVVEDVEQSPIFAGTASLKMLRDAGVRAVQSTPLVCRKGRLLGILTTQWGAPHTPDEHALWRLDLLVRQTSDLIEQKRAEEQIRQSEQRLALAVSGTQIGVLEWNVATGEVRATEQVTRLLGLRPTTTTTTTTTTTLSQCYHYRDWAQRVHPEDLPAVEAQIQRCQAQRLPFEAEYRLTWPDGSIHWLVGRGVFQCEDQGAPSRFLGILMDVTARKQAEEALKAASAAIADEKNRLEAVMEALPVGLAIVDTKGGTIHANAAFERVWGSPRPPVRDVNDYGVYKAWWPDTGKSVEPEEWASAATLQKGKAVIGQLMEIQRFDGKRAFVLNSAVPIEDAHGQLAGAAVAILDISDLKRAEATLRQSEERLRQLNQELERSNADLQQFAYVASHDLREPLRAISGFMDLLRRRCKDTLDEKANEYINYAAGGAKRMDDLLTGLLAYSRVQTQGKPRTAVPAQAALNAAMENLRADIDESSAAITSDPLPSVNADGMQFTQLLQNLLHNAIKFRNDQRPEIHVGCTRQQDNWLFSVSDNGIGIAPEFHERIFTMFHRVNPQDKRCGYGVGLSICKKIVERHNGRMWVESKPGKGSTFYFTIPAEK